MEDLQLTAATRVVGVIGHPVRHSLSPVIHNAGFRSTGVDYVYVAFDVAPGAARAALDSLRVLELAGLSVTMPHKTDVALAVDELVESARNLNSVNTVEVRPGGHLLGHSTDGDGLIASLRHRDLDVRDHHVAVIGAGGAARSVIDALARHGAASVAIVNRTLSSARSAIALAHGRGSAHSLNDEVDVRDVVSACEIIVNATSVGMDTDSSGGQPVRDLPFDTDLLRPEHAVVDLVYHPLVTPLLSAAADRGCRVFDGLGMLIHQAALQQEIWTSHRPDIAEMTEAALRALR